MIPRIAIAAALAPGAALPGSVSAQGAGGEAAALRAEIDALRSRLGDIEARQEEAAARPSWPSARGAA